MYDQLQRSGVFETVPQDQVFHSVPDALCSVAGGSGEPQEEELKDAGGQARSRQDSGISEGLPSLRENLPAEEDDDGDGGEVNRGFENNEESFTDDDRYVAGNDLNYAREVSETSAYSISRSKRFIYDKSTSSDNEVSPTSYERNDLSAIKTTRKKKPRSYIQSNILHAEQLSKKTRTVLRSKPLSAQTIQEESEKPERRRDKGDPLSRTSSASSVQI